MLETIMRILSIKERTLLVISSILLAMMSKIFSYLTQGNFLNAFSMN